MCHWFCVSNRLLLPQEWNVHMQVSKFFLLQKRQPLFLKCSVMVYFTAFTDKHLVVLFLLWLWEHLLTRQRHAGVSYLFLHRSGVPEWLVAPRQADFHMSTSYAFMKLSAVAGRYGDKGFLDMMMFRKTAATGTTLLWSIRSEQHIKSSCIFLDHNDWLKGVSGRRLCAVL